jgi:uncharacterized membrane protein
MMKCIALHMLMSINAATAAVFLMYTQARLHVKAFEVRTHQCPGVRQASSNNDTVYKIVVA